MAIITRCDECKKVSDEPGVGYIGTDWQFRKYNVTLGFLKTTKDLCGKCVRKLTDEHYPTELSKDYVW